MAPASISRGPSYGFCVKAGPMRSMELPERREPRYRSVGNSERSIVLAASDSVLCGDSSAFVASGFDPKGVDPVWPVGERQFHRFVRAVHAAYEEKHRLLAGEDADLWLADYTFVTILIQVVHAGAAKVMADAAGKALILGPRTERYHRPAWKAWADAYRPPQANLAAPLLRRLRQLRRRYLYNAHLSKLQRVLASLGTPSTWSLGALHALKDEVWLAGERVDFPVVEKFADLPVRMVPIQPQLKAAVQDFLKTLHHLGADHFGVALPVEEAGAAWQSRLSDLAGTYRKVLALRRKPLRVVVGSAGDPIIRTIALALRRSGAVIVSVLHGHNVGYTYETDRSIIDVSIASEFVAPSVRAAASLARLARAEDITRNQAVSFISCATTQYVSQLERSSSRVARPDGQKAVLLVGYAYNGHRYTYGAGLFDPMRRDLELRLVRSLRNLGYRVIYKPHPSTQDIARLIFESEVDVFDTRPFSAAVDAADILLFTYPQTTTLGDSVTGSHPIVLLDVEDQRWNEEVRLSLSTRCHMVSARIDGQNRIDFSEQDVAAGLERAFQAPVSHQYVTDFLGPP
jgi:hypothetical protein